MFESLLRLHLEGQLSSENLEKAVNLKWITNEQKEKILSSKLILSEDDNDDERVTPENTVEGS